MSDLIHIKSQRDPRLQLLLSVSSAALVVFSFGVKAEDTGHPAVWIELGGAFDRISHDSVDWVPPNLTDPITNASPKPFGSAPSIGYDFDGTVSLQPNGSDWVFSMSMRYGRAQRGPKRTHDQAYPLTPSGNIPSYAFLNAAQQSRSTHAIVDFTAGRDVGMGLFNSGLSTIHFGVRAAQLNENATGHFSAFSTAPAKYSGGKVVHKADALFARSFTGAGPSVSWDGATPLTGSADDGVTFDWGVDAAVLVGRQKADLSLHTSNTRGKYQHPTVISHSTVSPGRDRTVVVPNLGGFAGISWRLPEGKISMGYRADFFFGAIDGGLTSAQRHTIGFHGPFASVSIGLGG